MKYLSKEYQLWSFADSGYHLEEFDDLNDLLKLIPDIHTSNFYITKKIDVNIIVCPFINEGDNSNE